MKINESLVFRGGRDRYPLNRDIRYGDRVKSSYPPVTAVPVGDTTNRVPPYPGTTHNLDGKVVVFNSWSELDRVAPVLARQGFGFSGRQAFDEHRKLWQRTYMPICVRLNGMNCKYASVENMNKLQPGRARISAGSIA